MSSHNLSSHNMSSHSAPVDPVAVAQTLIHYRWRWIIPTVTIASIALVYAVFKSATWESSQALLVRDEAIGGLRPGRFDDPDSMKSAQETVLEMAKSRSVVTAALRQVGPASGSAPANWPTARDIKYLRRQITIAAPNGAEFGRTEVFYLKVQDNDPDRAVALTRAVCDGLDARLRTLRDDKSQSLIDELTKTVEMTRVDLDEATQRLSAKECSVGSDLGELRILNEVSSGASNLRQTLIEVKSELRQARTAQITNENLLELLAAAKLDPSQLISTPNKLLEAQPGLRQMKDGLVAAKLLTAQLLGDLTDQHPKVRSAVASQEEIERHLRGELDSAVAAIKAEMKLDESRIADLQQQVDGIDGRMNRLAEVRADYSNLITEVRQRGELFSKAQKDLSDARANQIAAHTASLITMLDGPALGDSPIGPGRSLIVLCGLCGGLMAGLGFVFLTVPVNPLPENPLSEISPPRTASAETLNRRPNFSDLVPRGLSLKEALNRITQYIPTWN